MTAARPVGVPDIGSILARRTVPVTRIVDDSRRSAEVPDAPVPPPSGPDGSVGEPGEPAAYRRRYLTPVSFYLPRSLHVRLDELANRTGRTMTAVLLGAINSMHAALPTFLTQQDSAKAGDLFAVPQRSRTRQPMVEGKFRATDEQLAAIDDLARRLAVSRSRIIAAALELYLAAASGV